MWLAPGPATAALIELPGATPDRGVHAALSWQETTRRLHHAANADAGVPADYLTVRLADTVAGVSRVGTRPWSRSVAGTPDDGIYAAIDAPFGAMDAAPTEPAAPLHADPESEFWTLLLVGAGLVAYQVRRKSRMGSFRVRPL
jgi:hypothetical protein